VCLVGFFYFLFFLAPHQPVHAVHAFLSDASGALSWDSVVVKHARPVVLPDRYRTWRPPGHVAVVDGDTDDDDDVGSTLEPSRKSSRLRAKLTLHPAIVALAAWWRSVTPLQPLAFLIKQGLDLSALDIVDLFGALSPGSKLADALAGLSTDCAAAKAISFSVVSPEAAEASGGQPHAWLQAVDGLVGTWCIAFF
jgi:hypothetical protein